MLPAFNPKPFAGNLLSNHPACAVAEPTPSVLVPMERHQSIDDAHDVTPHTRNLGLVRSSSESDLSLHQGKEPPKTLHDLIGAERAQALDVQFASLQPMLMGKDSLKPWEVDENGKALLHPRRLVIPDKGPYPDLKSEQFQNVLDLKAVQRGEKKYIWSMSAMGQLMMGEDAVVSPSHPTWFHKEGRVPRLGHPMLLLGGPARISGELRYEGGQFVINPSSGRYSRYVDRGDAQLQAVAEIFRQSGLPVQPVKPRKEKRNWPLKWQPNTPIGLAVPMKDQPLGETVQSSKI
jgi:hypothetical protein